MPNAIAYGFIELKDLFAERIVTIQAQTINTAVQQSMQIHTSQVNELLAAMVVRTTEFKRRYQLPAGHSLQPLDESGNPKPVQPSGFYDVAFPLFGAGHAWGSDRVTRAMMTVEDANRFTWDAMDADADWMRRHLLAALFTNTTWTYTDKEFGALVIQCLANGDTVKFLKKSGVIETDTHYLFQAAAIADANNPFPTIYAELDEHPSNSGPYVAYVASNLTPSIQLLTALDEPPNSQIAYADTAQTLAGQQSDLNVTSYGGPMARFGDRVLGIANNVWVVEWAALPSNYIVGHATGANDVLAMREWPAPELQGLFPEFFSPDGNIQINRVLRYAGFGVQNRVGALVMQIGAGAYSIPAGYSAPLPA
jgi:hypothetical protein